MDSRKRFRIICLTLFIIYSIAIVYFLLFSDWYGRIQGYAEFRYNLIPFREIGRFIRSALNNGSIRPLDVFVNVLGNIIAFIPFGALIRWVCNRKVGFFFVVLNTFLFSLAIEVLQFFTHAGVFDVDDLILNTLGGALGYAIYRILRAIDRKRYKDDKEESKTL